MKIAREVRRNPVLSKVDFIEKAKCRRVMKDDVEALHVVINHMAADPNEQTCFVESQTVDVGRPMDWLSLSERLGSEWHVNCGAKLSDGPGGMGKQVFCRQAEPNRTSLNRMRRRSPCDSNRPDTTSSTTRFAKKASGTSSR